MSPTLRPPVPLIAEWPPARPAMTTRQRVIAVLGLLAVALLYIARLGAGSTLLEPTDEQCEKWPPYKTAECYEMVPLDEVHYVPDARDVLRFGTESTIDVPTDDDGAYVVHPPVGKWFIAAGIALVGDEPMGWRLFNALAGVLGVALAFSLARRLFGSFAWAMVAGGLLAIDGLWFVMSRLAMLDIATGLTTLAAVRASVELVARSVEDRPRAKLRVLTGVLWGLALATKWSTAPFAVVAGLMLLFAEVSAWRRSKLRRVTDPSTQVRVFGREAIEQWADALVLNAAPQSRTGGPRALTATLGCLTVLPIAVYVATFAPWFADSHRYVPPACENRSVPASWVCYQTEILNFHRDLEKFEAVKPEDQTSEPTASDTVVDGIDEEQPVPTFGTETPAAPESPIASSTPGHPYFGNGITWAWIGRPVVHAYRGESTEGIDHAVEVMSVPNPITWWWAFFFALPWLIVVAYKDRTARIILAFITAGWLPYLLADLVDRPVFLFYATPLVPFLMLAATALLKRLWDGPPGAAPSTLARSVSAGVVISAGAVFVFMYPVLAGVPLPLDTWGWHARIWFAVDCTVETIKVMCWI
jgi:dolichyl-phosphate-mannose-protein mannosyltransferase